MEGNGHPDITTFEGQFSLRLQRYEAAGMSQDDLSSLRQRGLTILAALQEFRTQRRRLGDSGRFTRQGLQDELATLASAAAGSIQRSQDGTVLEEQIRQVKAKLAAKASKADPSEALVAFWRQMEVRSQLDRLGITILDPAKGELSFDTIKADQLYRDALDRGDALTQEALEEWPFRSPVSPDLIAQGQAKRLQAADPINAKKLADLEHFREALQVSVNDALQELREFLPVADPIAEMAGPSTPPDAA